MDEMNAVPKYTFERIVDITPDDFIKMGVKAVGIDLDNTTVYDSGLKLLPGARDWVRKIKAAGFPVVIVTNTYTLRALIIANKLRIPYYAMSAKPKTANLFKAAARAGVDIKEFAMIGDNIFADVLAANNAGAVSIRVKPFMTEWFRAKTYRRIRRREKEYLDNHST